MEPPPSNEESNLHVPQKKIIYFSDTTDMWTATMPDGYTAVLLDAAMIEKICTPIPENNQLFLDNLNLDTAM